MSIKTLRKRIALVAVSALGVGVLSVTPAFAAAVGANETDITSTSALIVCSVSADKETAYVPLSSDGVVISFAAGAQTDTGVMEISGPGYWSAVANGTNGTLARTSLTLVTLTDIGDGGDSTATLKPNGTGTITVTIRSAVGAVAIDSLTIYVQAKCTDGVYSADDSEVSVSSSATDDPADDNNVDVTLSAAAGSALYVRVQLNNEYASAITTGTLSASATNGALVRWGSTQAAVAAGVNSADTTTPDGTDQLRVDAPAEAGISTVVTILHDGVTVATKTLIFAGEVASIDIVKAYSGTIGTSGAGTTTGFFLYQYKDAAGNVVPASGLTVDATTVSTQIPTANSEKAPSSVAAAVTGNLVDAIETAIGSTTYGVMSFACGATAGTAKITVETTNAVTGDDVTKEVSLSCFGGVDTYVVSTDKASYNVGEVATITITAKDAKGNPVSDASTMGATETVSVGGGSLTKAVAAGDAFSGGVRTYKAQMTTAGSFNVVVTVSGTTTKSATAAYSVKDASAGVTNAEVLAAIVKLIASINEQIALLQKQLKKAMKK